jgi:hypothetical protein
VSELVRLIHATRADKHAVVSIDRQPDGSGFVQVARGKKRTALIDVRMFGPFKTTGVAGDELAKAFGSIVDGLRAEGYEPPGVGATLAELEAKAPAKRAHAALRLSWLKEARAVPPLLKLLDKPKEEVSTVVEALGRIGDAQAVPAVRVEAERKLLSRRRAGVEALALLQDASGLAAARTRALERLPDPVRAVVTSAAVDAAAIANALTALDAKERGLAVDTVYELASSQPEHAAVFSAGARAVLLGGDTAAITAPHMWRYTKSVWKRSMVRLDHQTFGALSHRIEIRARIYKGVSATVKSGYDGETRTVRVFSKKTGEYVRRRAWRHLKTLARFRPDDYAFAAAHALVPYVDGDDLVKGASVAVGTTGHGYVFHRILFGASPRYVFDSRKLRFRPAPAGKSKVAAPGAREESFADLWDRQPRAYVTLLAHARHSAVQKFALDAVTARHRGVLADATTDELIAMVGADDPRIIDLGIAELRRRFDPANPDLSLVIALCSADRDVVRNHGLVWMNETAHIWTRRLNDVIRFLSVSQPQTRENAARLVALSAAALGAEDRNRYANALLAELEKPETVEGAHFGFSESILRAFLVEATAQYSLMKALALVEKGSDGALSVGAAILARKSGALDVLGLTRVLALATHDKVAVRKAALALMEGGLEDLKKDPAPLFSLVESDWEDVRQAAITLLEKIDVAALGLDGLLGLADSTREDVQRRAQKILDGAMERVDVHELLARLAQHPSRLMQAYAVNLAKQHLKPGFVRLVRLDGLFRGVLFDVGARKDTRRAVVAFLEERGQLDEAQAEVALAILGDFVRTRTVDDRERALAAIVKIKLRFPALTSVVTLKDPAGGARS